MQRVFPFRAVLLFLLTVWIAQAASSVHAQTVPTEVDCASAQINFVSAMEMFRAAYFQRRDSEGSAESVMADNVLPAAEQMYQACPEEVAAVIRSGVERANASLYDPRRGELVACDRALVAYKGSLSRFDNRNLSSYLDYRDLLYSDIDPSARAAVDACPQMPELEQQTRVEITERQRRVDRMEDIETRDALRESLDTDDE
jgi:hypothetical protein